MAFICFLPSSCRGHKTERRAVSPPVFVLPPGAPAPSTHLCPGAGRHASSALHRRGLLSRLQGEGARQLPRQLLQKTFISPQGVGQIRLPPPPPVVQALRNTAPLKKLLELSIKSTLVSRLRSVCVPNVPHLSQFMSWSGNYSRRC